MAYAAVTSLMGTLHLHLLQSEDFLPIEYKQEVVSLLENLGSLQDILEKSEIAYDNSVMKDLEARIRDVLFEAEVGIEMELSIMYHQTRSMIIKACLLRLHGIFNQAVKQTDYLKKKLIQIKSEKQLAKGSSITCVSLLGRMRRRGLLLGSTSSKPDLESENITMSKVSKKASKFDSRMVGCDKEFTAILDKLRKQSAKHLQVVSIVGMGGIGKTTLAQKVYDDPSITSHFDKRLWVTVSQEYNVEQMLRRLIGCVIVANDELPKQSHEQRNDNLAETLRKRLKDQRYLIVIDDIWNTDAWDSVQRCFPDDNNGSRILLTSRLREVAEYASSSGNSTISMPFLNANESWNLFCNVFGKTEFLLEFEQIGRYIVKKCEGLPLAITLVASLLSKTEELEKWENFAANVSRFVIGDSNDACSRMLYLSYNQLPYHLKTCFLYFGVFREDYEIPVKKLVRLWAAEGFLRAVNHRNTEEVGMECLQDLVDRSLVIVSSQSYSGEMKRIRIHDLLRDLCLRETRRESLLNVIRDGELSFYKRISQHLFSKPCRWISFTRPLSLNDQIFMSNCFHKSHSLHSTTRVDVGKYVDVERLVSHFKLLRVVDLRIHGDEDVVLYVFANLVHIRYLALNNYSTHYIGEFFEHWNMQGFIVPEGIWNPSEAASRVWRMPLLRNFHVHSKLRWLLIKT